MERYWNIRYWLARFWQSDYWRGHGGMIAPPPSLTDIAHTVIIDRQPHTALLPVFSRVTTIDRQPNTVILEITNE